MIQWSNEVIDFFFPPICLGCDKFGEMFCQDCRAKITETEELICPSCLRENATGEVHSKCEGNLDGLTSCWNYTGLVKKIIKSIKYRFYYAVVPELISLYCGYLQLLEQKSVKEYLASKPLVIPVPLHQKRLNYRGFNQAELIGRNLAQNLKLPFSTKILNRHRYTQPQAGLKRKERLINLTGAFSVSVEVSSLPDLPLENRNILLIDDVWTTGSTMQNCAGVLKELGAEKVWGLTLAR
jgi:competence protein ComFC